MLLWPEALKIKWSKNKASILAPLTVSSLLKIFEIAVRPTKQGSPNGSKHAIRVVFGILSFKSILYPTVIILGLFSSHIQLFTLIVIFAIFAMIEYLIWNDQLDTELKSEILKRESEFPNLQLQQIDNEQSTRGEARNDSALHGRVEDDLNIISIRSNLDKPVSYTEKSLPPASAETKAYLADLASRVESQRAQLDPAALLNPKDHIENGKVIIKSIRGKTVRIISKRGKTISVKSF